MLHLGFRDRCFSWLLFSTNTTVHTTITETSGRRDHTRNGLCALRFKQQNANYPKRGREHSRNNGYIIKKNKNQPKEKNRTSEDTNDEEQPKHPQQPDPGAHPLLPCFPCRASAALISLENQSLSLPKPLASRSALAESVARAFSVSSSDFFKRPLRLSKQSGRRASACVRASAKTKFVVGFLSH